MNPWACGFAILMLVQLLVIFTTFTDYGITIDEPPQVTYGEEIIKWYGSLFQYQAYFDRVKILDLERYGGLFETLAYPFTQLLPFSTFDTRHLVNALIGLTGILAAYRLGTLLGSPVLGLLSAVFLLLTPRYYGHIFNNPKDLPFAVFYLWSIYALIQCLEDLPDLGWRRIGLSGVAIGLALGTRVGGLILFGYLGLFFILRYLQLKTKSEVRLQVVRQGIGQLVMICAIAWITMLLFWPTAQRAPLAFPINALLNFAQYGTPDFTTTFFQGQQISITEVPRYYAPLWLLLALPEFLFLGLVAGSASLILSKPGIELRWVLLGFSAAFPLLLIVVLGTPLYDGLRHFLFVLPPLAVLSASGLYALIPRIRTTGVQKGLIGLTLLLLALTLWDMVRLHPNEYVYFNRLFAGGLQKASKQYATDYWENSYKQGIRWLDTHKSPPPGKRLRIGAGSQNVRYSLDPNRYEFVDVPENIHWYLSTTRDGLHKMVPGEIVHTIQRDGVALLYIIRPDGGFDQDPFFTPSKQRHIKLANQYDRSRDEKGAFEHYQKALTQDPDNPNILANLGRHYLLQKKYQEAVPYLERALELEPKYLNAYLHLGTAFHALGQIRKAAEVYLKTIALKPDLREPYVNLAIILIEMERWPETVKVLTEATKIHTTHPRIWQMLAQAYRQLGDLAKADASISRAFRLNPSEYSIQEEYALVAAEYQKQNQLERAGAIYRNILEINPKMPGAAFNLGLLYYKQNQFPKAIAAYEQAVSHFPKDPNPLLAMSLVFERQRNYQDAISACQKALKLTPDDPKIKARLQALETAGSK